MKGLIKYELKKMFSLWWLVYAAVMIFLFVVRTREETYNYFAYVLASIHIVKIAADTVRADEESGWLALQGILPVSKRQYLTVKYIRYGIVTALNCCFIYTLIGIRCALNGSFGILPFWVPVFLHLSLSIALAAMFPDILDLKGGGLRMLFIRIGGTVSMLGSAVLLIAIAFNPDWASRLFLLVIVLFVIGVSVFFLNVKARLEQFESYQLGISWKLQREDT